MSTYGFHKFWRNKFRRTSKIKFLLASMKPLTNCENPFRNYLQEACIGFQRAAWDSKVGPKAAYDPENCSESHPWMKIYWWTRKKNETELWSYHIPLLFLLPENLTHSKHFPERARSISMSYLYTDKKENKIFLIYKEIPRDRVQSHIWLTTSSYVVKIFVHFLIY